MFQDQFVIIAQLKCSCSDSSVSSTVLLLLGYNTISVATTS